MHNTIYSGHDLVLEHYDGGHPTSIVTFQARNKSLHATRPGSFGAGFGKGRFYPLGFNEFIIKRSRNHWYQTSEILDVIRIVNRIARGTKVITYGGSMGGFAAINFAPMLNAHRFVALSPLFDIAAGNEASEIRWENEGKILDFNYNFIKIGACRPASGYVFYCTRGLDARHAELIESETHAILVPVEYGGHPCSFYLNDTYKLKPIISEIAHDVFDIERFYRVLNERTLQTHYPYERRSVELSKAGDIDQAITNIEKAIEFKPDLARLHAHLAELFLKKNDIDGAHREYLTAIGLDSRKSRYFVRMSHVHASRGEFTEAVKKVERAIKLNPKKAEYYIRLGIWLKKKEDFSGALNAMQRAVQISPSNRQWNLHIKALKRLLHA